MIEKFSALTGRNGMRTVNSLLVSVMTSLIVFASMTSAVSAQSTQTTYYHVNLQGTPVAASDESGTVKWSQHYTTFGYHEENVGQAADFNHSNFGIAGHVEDQYEDLLLVYMQARYYDPMTGRFLSIDPVGFSETNPQSFNRYAYGNNNPLKYVDPDGRIAIVAAIPWAVGALKSFLFVGSAGVAGYVGSEAYNAYNESADSGDSSSSIPDLPKDLVGDQSDDRAGPNAKGNRHTSGPLAPEYGGVGDYIADLETLTGGTREAGEEDSAPAGAQIGENGVFGRTNSTGGKSIDIPANGKKPHETLHYD